MHLYGFCICVFESRNEKEKQKLLITQLSLETITFHIQVSALVANFSNCLINYFRRVKDYTVWLYCQFSFT